MYYGTAYSTSPFSKFLPILNGVDETNVKHIAKQGKGNL